MHSKTLKVNEVGEAIHEVYDSKGDILFGNEKVKIKPVRNLGGHNIEQYEIHAKEGFHGLSHIEAQSAKIPWKVSINCDNFQISCKKILKENSSYCKRSFPKRSL